MWPFPKWKSRAERALDEMDIDQRELLYQILSKSLEGDIQWECSTDSLYHAHYNGFLISSGKYVGTSIRKALESEVKFPDCIWTEQLRQVAQQSAARQAAEQVNRMCQEFSKRM